MEDRTDHKIDLDGTTRPIEHVCTDPIECLHPIHGPVYAPGCEPRGPRDPLAPDLVTCDDCGDEDALIACPGPLDGDGCEGDDCEVCAGDRHVPAWLADPHIVGDDAARTWGWRG